MIRSFGNREAELCFHGRHCRSLPPDLQRRAERTLKMLHAAQSLQDLLSPPGNRLEKLLGNRLGQNSLRIDRQWRICFRWVRRHALEVAIVDDH